MSAKTSQRVDQSEQSAAEDDWNNIPFPAQHSDKRDCANREREPVNGGAAGKERVDCEPNCQVHYHTYDCRSNRGKRGSEFHIAPQLLDMRSAQKNKKKTRRKRGPGRDERTERAGEKRR